MLGEIFFLMMENPFDHKYSKGNSCHSETLGRD